MCERSATLKYVLVVSISTILVSINRTFFLVFTFVVMYESHSSKYIIESNPQILTVTVANLKLAIGKYLPYTTPSEGVDVHPIGRGLKIYLHLQGIPSCFHFLIKYLANVPFFLVPHFI